MILHAKKVRVLKEDDDDRGDLIHISPEWEQQLQAFPQVSSKLQSLIIQKLKFLI